VARFRSNLAIRPVHRIKHIIDSSATLASGAATVIPLVQSVDAPVLANTPECETGSKVNGIYLKVEVASNETVAGAIPNVYMLIVKNPGNNLTGFSANGMGSNDNKRFVIHQEMIMLNNLAGGQPRVLFNGVVAIPRGYRRNGPNDVLNLVILSPAVNITLCIQCHYKEFR